MKAGVTTQNLGDNLIPRRMNIGDNNHLRKENEIMRKALLSFAEESSKNKENNSVYFDEVFNKVKSKAK